MGEVSMSGRRCCGLWRRGPRLLGRRRGSIYRLRNADWVLLLCRRYFFLILTLFYCFVVVILIATIIFDMRNVLYDFDDAPNIRCRCYHDLYVLLPQKADAMERGYVELFFGRSSDFVAVVMYVVCQAF